MAGFPHEAVTGLTDEERKLLTCKACNLILDHPSRCSLCQSHICAAEFRAGIEEGECPVCHEEATRFNMRQSRKPVLAAYEKGQRKC